MGIDKHFRSGSRFVAIGAAVILSVVWPGERGLAFEAGGAADATCSGVAPRIGGYVFATGTETICVGDKSLHLGANATVRHGAAVRLLAPQVSFGPTFSVQATGELRVGQRPARFALAYGPYRTGQAPGRITPSAAEIREDMALLAPQVDLVRSYRCHPTEWRTVTQAAFEYGVGLFQGLSIGTGTTANDDELACLLELAVLYPHIRAAVVGNEVLLTGLLSEQALIDILRRAQSAALPVTTGDTWYIWCKPVAERCQTRPNLAAAVDFILIHVHPYWETLSVDLAAAAVVANFLTIRALYPDKDVWIGETGWPTAGPINGDAVPSVSNQALFIETLWSWTTLLSIPTFYFEAFDEPWKTVDEGAVGAHWGVYGVDRTLKHAGLSWVPRAAGNPGVGPSIEILYPPGTTNTTSKSNCGIPVFGRAYNAKAGWKVMIEVLTNQWYPQDRWYVDGKVPVVDRLWGVPDVLIAGTGMFNKHSIRATLLDEDGFVVAVDTVDNIVRTRNCTPP